MRIATRAAIHSAWRKIDQRSLRDKATTETSAAGDMEMNMKVMKVWLGVAAVLVVIALGYNALFNQRSDEEQRYYDFGYETASELIDEGADSEEEVLQGCDVTAAARGYANSSVALKPFNSGCRDRWEEEG